MAEIPDEVTIPPIISIGEGKIATYTSWGITYKLTELGETRIANMGFRKKSDAEGWIKQYFKNAFEAKVIPVRHKVWIDERGNIKSEIEALS